MTMVFLLTAVIFLCGAMYYLLRVNEQHQMFNESVLRILEELNRNDERIKARLNKVEQIAANAQNKAVANQKRIEKGIVYEPES